MKNLEIIEKYHPLSMATTISYKKNEVGIILDHELIKEGIPVMLN